MWSYFDCVFLSGGGGDKRFIDICCTSADHKHRCTTKRQTIPPKKFLGPLGLEGITMSTTLRITQNIGFRS